MVGDPYTTQRAMFTHVQSFMLIVGFGSPEPLPFDLRSRLRHYQSPEVRKNE